MTTMGELLWRTAHPAGWARRASPEPPTGPAAVVDAALALLAGTPGPSKEFTEDVLLALAATVGVELEPAGRTALSHALLDVTASPVVDRRALVDHLLDVRGMAL
jgi:hypothetical protein